MSKQEKDIYQNLKYAGFYLAQAIYASDTGITSIKDLIKKYTAKMFNYIHSKRQVEFLILVEKIYAGIGIQPHMSIIQLLRVQEMQEFQKLALAFMIGFMSDKKNDEE